jgi:hypothetical protein
MQAPSIVGTIKDLKFIFSNEPGSWPTAPLQQTRPHHRVGNDRKRQQIWSFLERQPTQAINAISDNPRPRYGGDQAKCDDNARPDLLEK